MYNLIASNLQSYLEAYELCGRNLKKKGIQVEVRKAE